MQNLVSEKPYVPVPPYHGKIWPMMLSWYVPRLLRKHYGVMKVECVGAEKLAASIRAGHGVLIAPNHCRDEDPMVLGMLSRAVKQPFFIMASAHLFMQTKQKAFLLRRAGAFSIYREGIDRAAINTAIEILETAKRPLIIFPEGYIARTNDQLNELMDGAALIARSAAKKRAKLTPPGKVVVHPVAIRYRFNGDINAVAAKVLDQIEARLSWRPNKAMPLHDRIVKAGTALLTLKELEIIGSPQQGDIWQRLANLTNAILNPMEDEWCDGKHDGTGNARVKRLRGAILPDLTKGELDEAERQRRWKQLADVYLAMQLFHYPPDYVKSNSKPERILETLERFEEDLTDNITIHGSISATVTVGDAIEVKTERERNAADPLLAGIESQLRGMLGLKENGEQVDKPKVTSAASE